ncbi:Nucleotide-binding universal stress protein, UspA family [Litoreibacter ascidiaceicola]|uniref:Nucleotide-binding universal stress protein, UspA family n=1 Tax=Litoreibacter ascidiaceicola TaxID=1486859 RepID=A0A1M4T032_9RHOB|nr:universal stress protein [Litoreibacter ascidiaceicola]SHE37872.1 Nucleotide-binding universal stress protein, UspA family [Litoreibacter ascidiaceicola]
MKNATILSIIGANCPTETLSPVADAARAHNLHLAYLAVGAIPQFPNFGVGMLPYGSPVVPDTWQESVQQVNTDLKAKLDEVEAMLAKEGLSGDVSSVYAEPAGLAELVSWRAKVCDLALICNGLRSEPLTFKNVLHGLLFNSAAPVVLNDSAGVKTLSAKNILVAWNTSLPASRAVKRAIPLLKQAESVTIACFDPKMSELADGENPGSDVGKWLTHHGCNVTVEQHPSGGKEVATCILERAAEVGTDLVVAGAYGHSRLRENLFGGTTASLSEQTDVAVFMAH